MKAKIIKIGWIADNGFPMGWEFDCGGESADLDFVDGQLVLAGWSVKELADIVLLSDIEALKTENTRRKGHDQATSPKATGWTL